jgi:hypothetical protein
MEAPRAVHNSRSREDWMKTFKLVTRVAAVAVIGLVMAPGQAPAQNHAGKASTDFDFAKARADADAKANNRQYTDVDGKNKLHSDIDVKNKLNQKQIGLGGNASADVKNKNANVNVNSLTTGDVINVNTNDNKQIQSFGLPFLRGATPNSR